MFLNVLQVHGYWLKIGLQQTADKTVGDSIVTTRKLKQKVATVAKGHCS